VNGVILDLSSSDSISDVSVLENSAVRDLNISFCDEICDITMLKKVRKLNIINCRNITNPSGLFELREVFTRNDIGFYNFQGGLAMISHISKLEMNVILRIQENDPWITAMRKAPLTALNLMSFPIIQVGFSEVVKFLQHLNILELTIGEVSVTIPALPSLGNVRLFSCRLKYLCIEGSAEDYPIYNFTVVQCFDLPKLSVSRFVSLMEIQERLPQDLKIEIVGRDNIKDLVISDFYTESRV
jgi:hypothetical protein